MNDPLVRLSEVIELILKADRKGKKLNADSVIVDLLRAFKSEKSGPKPKLAS